ncbi:MAG: response regulator transcription factor [Bacteroidota bacterium]
MIMSQKSLKILIVDDDKAFLTMITGAITSLDDRLLIETARSGKECLQKVKKFSPNLVFLDIGMDGMNGLVTLRFIKSMDTKTLVYFLSGHAVEYIRDAVGMVEADGYFTKTQFLDLLKTARSLEEILKEGNTAL